MNITFMMMNTLNMKQMHIDQELKLTTCRKSAIDIQCVKPQIQAHLNKVPKRRDHKRSEASQYLQRYRSFVPSKLTTLNRPEPYFMQWKSASQSMNTYILQHKYMHKNPKNAI